MDGEARGRRGKRVVAVSIVALTVVSVVIFAAIVAMFLGLREREKGIAASVREDALWAAYQTDREAGRLIESIVLAELAPGPDAFARVHQSYDVLFSRADIVDEAKFAVDMGGASALGAAAGAARQEIRGLAPIMDALLARPEAMAARLPGLRERTLAIRRATEALVLRTKVANSEARVTERQEVRRTHVMIAYGVVVLMLALGLIVLLLVAQLVHISRTGRALREMAARNVKAARAAEAGNRAKSAFLAAMSHEIRTPLNGIIGTSELLAETPLSREQSGQVAMIRRSGDLLLDVINDVLDFSKLESGKVDVAVSDVALGEVIETVRAVMAPRAAASGLELTIEAPDAVIATDPARLRQVLVNLVGNAIKFTPEGSIAVVAEPVGHGRMRFSVKDTGVGIPDEALPKLFLEFSQVDGSFTRRFGGTGLGLAICKRLVEALEGEIGVESRPGLGSRFWFELPVGELRPVPPPRVAEPLAELTLSGRVLVVEDNPINRDVVSGLLRRLGLKVETAEDGSVAVAKTGARAYDLVLMDMQMPTMDGLAATRAIRARGDTVPIVGLTANAFVSDREACLEAGMDGFMAKPVTRAKLSAGLAPFLATTPGAPEPVGAEPAGPEPVAVPVVDADYREALVRDLGPELVRKLVADLAVSGLELVTRARQAWAEGEIEVSERSLHTLTGAAASLGFVEIARTAQSARDAGADADDVLGRLEWLIRGVAA